MPPSSQMVMAKSREGSGQSAAQSISHQSLDTKSPLRERPSLYPRPRLDTEKLPLVCLWTVRDSRPPGSLHIYLGPLTLPLPGYSFSSKVLTFAPSLATGHISLQGQCLAKVFKRSQRGSPGSSKVPAGLTPLRHSLGSLSLTLSTSVPSLSTLPTATSIAPTGTLWGPLTSRPSADCWATRVSPWSWRNC